MRPGRLDRILYVGPPDLDARIDIFSIRFRSMTVEPGTDARELALLVSFPIWRVLIAALNMHLLQTDGCSGAELVSICQDAALAAMNENLEAPHVGAPDQPLSTLLTPSLRSSAITSLRLPNR